MQVSLAMSIADYVPTLLYMLAALTLYKYVKKANPFPAAVYLLGAFMVFAAGFLKATYKLLLALDIGEFPWMTDQFFSNQAIGFLICGIGMLTAAISRKKVYSLLPTMALVGIMVAGLAMTDISLCFIAAKAKKKGCILFFIPAMILCLAMGYLSTKDFASASMNWLAEGLNAVAQLLLFLGAKKLAKE